MIFNDFFSSKTRSFYKCVLILLILIFSIKSYSQEENFIVPDTLKNLSYKDLRKRVSEWYLKRKSSELKIYANTYFAKAQKENDSLRIAEGYEFLSYTVFKEPKEEFYIDKAIEYSKNLNGFYMPGLAYYTKAGINSDRNDYEAALKYYLLAHDAAENGNNQGLESQVKYELGSLKNRIGAYDEAHEYALARWEYIRYKKIDNAYLASLFLLSVTNSFTKRFNDASKYNEYGVILSRKLKRKNFHNQFILLEGVNHFFRKNYTVAIDSLKKTIPQLKVDNEIKNLATSYMYIGKAYKALDNREQSIFYLKKMDSIFNITSYLLPYTRSGYKDLIEYAKNNKDLREQLYYTNQLLKLDSILDVNYKSLSASIYKDFESVELVKNKEKLIEELDKKNKTALNYIILSLLIAFLILVAFLYNYVKRKRDYIKFTTIIEEKHTDVERKIMYSKKDSSTIDISEEVIQKVLDRLDKFEKDKEFLKPNITLGVISKKVKTNTKYVSKIINTYKKKSAINYLNDLRINYAIQRLKHDPTFRKYTIKSIAEEIGYANHQAFATAFYKKTGLKPSYFVREIEKKEKSK